MVRTQEVHMKLAICDDSTKFLNAFRTELYKLDPSISLVCYTSYDKLTQDFSVISFDAVIINTEINSESGIDTAVKLVIQKPGTEVIFVTDKPDKYIQLIYAHADVMKPFALFVKPVSRLFMQHIINMLNDTLKNRFTSSLLIKNSSREILTLRLSEIKYIEHNNRISYIHTDNDVIQCRKPIQFFEDNLPVKYFIHASKSMIVNISKVNSIQQNVINLKCGEIIYASRNYRKEFVDHIMQFASDISSLPTPFYI